MEERISTLEDYVHPIMQASKNVIQKLTAHNIYLEDLDNWLHRNNIRVVGMPEWVEGKAPVELFEKWLKNMLGAENFTPLFAVERAHRVTARPLPTGSGPRTFILRMLNYNDRDIILQKARQLLDIKMEGSRIFFFPDFSAEVQQQRAKFSDVKCRLLQAELTYSILYLARLWVVAQGNTHFFESPEATAQWLNTYRRSAQSPNQV